MHAQPQLAVHALPRALGYRSVHARFYPKERRTRRGAAILLP